MPKLELTIDAPTYGLLAERLVAISNELGYEIGRREDEMELEGEDFIAEVTDGDEIQESPDSQEDY